MLGFRTNVVINKKSFKYKYNINIEELFNYKRLVKDNILLDDSCCLRVSEEYFYVLDEVTLKFLETLQTNVYNDIIEISEACYE